MGSSLGGAALSCGELGYPDLTPSWFLSGFNLAISVLFFLGLLEFGFLGKLSSGMGGLTWRRIAFACGNL